MTETTWAEHAHIAKLEKRIAELEEVNERLLMSRARNQAKIAVMAQALAQLARGGTISPRDVIKAADDAALAVKREDLTVASVANAYLDLGEAERRADFHAETVRQHRILLEEAESENKRLRAAIRAFFAVHDELGAFSLGDVEDNLRELVEDAGPPGEGE